MDHMNHHGGGMMGHGHMDHSMHGSPPEPENMGHVMGNFSGTVPDFMKSIADSDPMRQGHDMHQGHNMHQMSSTDHDMSMDMTFHGGVTETILFAGWKVTNVGEFIGSFIAVFIAALLYEGLKYYRKHLLWKTYTGLQYCAVAPPDKGISNACATDEPRGIPPVPHLLDRNVPRMLSSAHMWQTFLHGVQVVVSYMLMLVFMSYNTWLCAAVVLGSATGYFLFGWRESVVVDFTEHCH